MLKDDIAKRLDRIRVLDDKILLKESLNEIFLALYETSEAKYKALEDRVYQEIPLVRQQFFIYSTVLPKARADLSHAYLRPVDVEDAQEKRIDLRQISESLQNGIPYRIGTVFYEADYFAVRRLKTNAPVFEGVLRTNLGDVEVRCKLTPADRYLQKVRHLYQMFARNSYKWTTINTTYLTKFFDVCVSHMNEPAPDMRKAVSYDLKLSLGKEDSALKRNMVPVWNVERHYEKGDDFPMPALDKVNYEYRFNLEKLGPENGFLVDQESSNMIDVRREQDSLIAVSPQPKSLMWDLYAIIRRLDTATDIYPYPIVSNAVSDTFMERLYYRTGASLKTKAELYRLIDSFEDASYLEFVDYSILSENAPSESYGMDPFLLDEIRDVKNKKTLMLRFRPKDRGLFLNRDIMSFLVSQVQYKFPEYNCVGVLA